MFFRKKRRRPDSPELQDAWAALDSSDVPGALRLLRGAAEEAPLAEVALVVERAATAADFTDLAEAASALTGGSREPRPLFRFGYACIERGVPFLAIPALRVALREAPDSLAIMRELVSAYEREGRHREAADELARYEGRFEEWPDRYLLVFNSLMAGDLEAARRHHAPLGDPEDPVWQPTRERQNLMLRRAADAERAGPLDRTDLRGWQYVLGGTVLGTLSPYGFDAGMTGRYAFLQDEEEQCLRGLLRLRALLEATGVRPRSVSLLPDRDSRVLGLAAAEILGLPAEPFAPDREDTVVVAYDLNELAGHEDGPDILVQLRERAPGQVLHEHASCWTDPPVVAADSVTLLHQVVTAPWGAQLRSSAEGGVERGPADDRPEQELAAMIVAASKDPEADTGDGEGPDDSDEVFTAFAATVRDSWLQGSRSALQSSGPVPSSRFA
ncbi:tetratricopeptide repeat protein [Streptomyces sp. NPDC048241]|uniref:tetratricopeptide repeat protein n=1 Tax=Streptomyces sp. NPDC048241 TaxID=3365521 RepID=UPI003719E548